MSRHVPKVPYGSYAPDSVNIRKNRNKRSGFFTVEKTH